MKIITHEILHEITKPMLGMSVSYVWQGHGSAIFLELGKLTKHKGENNPFGEFTIMIQDSWRVEGKNNILFGSWSEDEQINKSLALLVGEQIKTIEPFGTIPELRVQLSSRKEVKSFATTEGDPQWAIILPGGVSVHSRKGKLVQEPNEKIS